MRTELDSKSIAQLVGRHDRRIDSFHGKIGRELIGSRRDTATENNVKRVHGEIRELTLVDMK